jgi:hypothetical protein
MTEGDGAGTEGEVIYDFRDVTASGAIINVFACHADPEEYPNGVHYRYLDEEDPIVRYDNENIEGAHERHEGDEIEEIDFSGADALRERFEQEVREYERTQ